MKGSVLVRLRPEVLDPQGTTVAQALVNLGYEDVLSVRQGKVFEVELDTDDAAGIEDRLQAMATDLLANPVIEEFQVNIPENGAAGPAAADRAGAEVDDGDSEAETDDDDSEAETDDDDSEAETDDDDSEADDSDRRSGDDRRDGEDRRDGDERRSGDELNHGEDPDYSGPGSRRPGGGGDR